jgi:hypothetical protein
MYIWEKWRNMGENSVSKSESSLRRDSTASRPLFLSIFLSLLLVFLFSAREII